MVKIKTLNKKIKCFACGMYIEFTKKNNFKPIYYGVQDLYITCDCGAIFRLKMTIYPLYPGGIKDEWEE